LSFVEIAGRTDVGLRRSQNEDAIYFTANVFEDVDMELSDKVTSQLNEAVPLLIVTDGMGGHADGGVAADLAIKGIRNSVRDQLFSRPEQEINQLLKKAQFKGHKAILEFLQKNPESVGMGTTSVVLLAMDDYLHISWVGDSRAYVLIQNKDANPKPFSFKLLSDDHSMVWEEVMKGNLTPEQARVSQLSNVITQSLGDIKSPPEPEYKKYPIDEKLSSVMLCSDGLNGMMPDDIIAATIIKNRDQEPQVVAEALIEQAKSLGGNDNISVVLGLFDHENANVEIKKSSTSKVSESVDTVPVSKPVKRALAKWHMSSASKVFFLLTFVAGMYFFLTYPFFESVDQKDSEIKTEEAPDEIFPSGGKDSMDKKETDVIQTGDTNSVFIGPRLIMNPAKIEEEGTHSGDSINQNKSKNNLNDDKGYKFRDEQQ
jgi:protein phosphatase